MGGVSDPVNDVDLMTARQWCLKRALSREPKDNGKALALGAAMMRLVQFGPPDADEVPAAEALPDTPAPPEAGAETGVLDPVEQSDAADADVPVIQQREGADAATELRPAMRGVLEALIRRLDTGDEVSLGLLGAELGKTPAAVGYSMRRLKELGYLRAEGNTGNTKWFVLRNVDGTPAEAVSDPAGDDPDPVRNRRPDPAPIDRAVSGGGKGTAVVSVALPDRVRNSDPHAHLMTAAGGKPGVRVCLRCQQEFDSAGIKERICKRCKLSPEWRTGPTTDAQVVSS